MPYGSGNAGSSGRLTPVRLLHRAGTQALSSKSFITDQESPIKDRWGGWYVTGKLGTSSNMGNAIVDEKQGAAQPDLGAEIHLAGLNKAFDSSSYLIPDSDVVAHLVLAHQTQMHNLITLTNYKTRLALYAQAQQNKASGQTGDAVLTDSGRQQFERPAEQLLRYTLFANEAPLSASGNEKIEGSSSFAREFTARGGHDFKDRSLRDFDLRTRIFRYPCSYLIYTESFDDIPEPARPMAITGFWRF
jgi:hypothetical protein